jgi:hypothetical protein
MPQICVIMHYLSLPATSTPVGQEPTLTVEVPKGTRLGFGHT